ncbi:IS4 family transposase [Bradyrhizobium diazoefficiens]|uniref:IS4 family transposase n=1 Tax=Bradyrhizobium diazoefficiens TaxID=1355477 RepID=UPI00190A940A|nr:IS4 family transposase [Bradyrhizobium diazoefficiens]MBK3661961.1 IS4 family transposase [Bradyrhizobium diazoefficiens]MBK3662102.1 IS4 family transposase [Bradyrhizobium diazoefficiens]
MVAGKNVCLRQLSRGDRSLEVRFNRFLGHDKVTTERIIESWSESTVAAVEGRHVLAIQDTSEIHFNTTPQRRRGLGEIGHGNSHGVLLHPLLAVDADNGTCLGLLTGEVWTREGRRTLSHDSRELSDKESQRWSATALAAKPLLASATGVTLLGDRESDIFALYASAAEHGYHVIARSMHDRKLADSAGLYAAIDAMVPIERRTIQLPARAQRPARQADLELRFGAIELARPQSKFLRDLPKSLHLAIVDVREINAGSDVEPLHWCLLTSHEVAAAEGAWRIVEWYKQRWIIEQFFRVLKTQGLKLEDSQIGSADRLLKLVAIAAKAAVITIQLLQARDGSKQSAHIAFNASEIAMLAALNRQYEAKSKRLKNPYLPDSLPWAAWIIGRLGGWDGYPSSRPPGPITFRNGLQYFHALAAGWSLRDMCMP